MTAGYRVITVDECERRFSVAADIDYPYQDFVDQQEIRLYYGDLHVDGHFESDNDDDEWTPYNTIVNGDLTVAGDLSWGDFRLGDFVLVTGQLRARHVLLTGCPTLLVRGDLTAAGVIMGDNGSDGGRLVVRGATRAQIVISRSDFIMRFTGSGGRVDRRAATSNTRLAAPATRPRMSRSSPACSRPTAARIPTPSGTRSKTTGRCFGSGSRRATSASARNGARTARAACPRWCYR